MRREELGRWAAAAAAAVVGGGDDDKRTKKKYSGVTGSHRLFPAKYQFTP